MNKVILIGRLVRDPELRYTQNNKAYCNFTVAVNRGFKNANNEYETDFINCQTWGKTAENLQRYMRKGSQIGVEGQIQINTAMVNGKTEYYTKVLVNLIEYLSKVETNTNQNTTPFDFNNNQDPKQDHHEPKAITDENLPF